MDLFPLYFGFARRAKFCKKFCLYQVSEAETLHKGVRPNPFQNLNTNCKKIPLSSPPPPTFAPLLPFNPPNVCPFASLPPLNPPPLSTPPPPPHLNTQIHPPKHLTPPLPPPEHLTPHITHPLPHLKPHSQTVNQTLPWGKGLLVNGQTLMGGYVE